MCTNSNHNFIKTSTTKFSSWTITSGNTDSIFAITAATGEVTVVDNSSLDFETTTSYTLSLTVSDGTNISAVESVAIAMPLISRSTRKHVNTWALQTGNWKS